MSAYLDVDGRRPAVAWVTSLPRSWVSDGERLVLLVLACDSFDGIDSSPGRDNLARWTGLLRGRVGELLAALEKPTANRPALLRREDSGGGRGRRGRVVLLPPIPADEPGMNEGPKRAGEPGMNDPPIPAAEPGTFPAGNLPGNLPGNRPVSPAGIDPKPAGGTGPSLKATTSLPPGAAAVLAELAAAVTGADASTALAEAVTKRLAEQWRPSELVAALLDGSPGGVGLLVTRARSLASTCSPAKAAAAAVAYQTAQQQAADCEHETPHGTFDAAGRHGPAWRLCALCRRANQAAWSA